MRDMIIPLGAAVVGVVLLAVLWFWIVEVTV